MSTMSVPTWTFGDRVRKIRREMHLTQEAFAEAIGHGEKAVASWESGRTQPENIVEVAREIEKAFGIPAVWLLGFDAPGGALTDRWLTDSFDVLAA